MILVYLIWKTSLWLHKIRLQIQVLSLFRCSNWFLNYFITLFSVYMLESNERRVLHTIESVIIKWSHQIHEIVEKDSVQPLLNGLHSNPQTELDFWMMRRENLSCIYDQVRR